MWKAPVRIYSQSKSSIQHGGVIMRRSASGKPESKSSSNLVTIGGTALVAAIGGSVVLAKASDGFRDFSEKYIPGTSLLYNLVLGPAVVQKPRIEFKPKQLEEGLMKRKLEREAIKKKDEPLIISSAGDPTLEPPKFSTEFAPSPVLEAVSPESGQSENITGSSNEVPPTPNTTQENESQTTPSEPAASSTPAENAFEGISMDFSGVDPAKFPILLKELHARAAEAVNQAVTAQDTAADAIKKHVEMVFKSLERIYEPGQAPENVWEPVFQATQEKTEAVHVAESRAKEARLSVALLKAAVAQALKSDQTKNSDLITLDESVARALYSLETASARVEAAQSEAKVMDEYRELVNTARRNLQTELSSIRPELAPTFKAEDTKLGEEELNILMAHAYWKIITLQKELAKQQALEQQRLKGALDSARKENGSILESRLRVELERQYYELKAQFSHDIAMHEKALSEQFTQQLKRQAAAYTDHLNDSLNTQQLEIMRKFEAERDLELAKLLTSYHVDLAKLHGMAKGIQDAVHGRADKDRVSRQVRELWVAAQSLVDSLRSNATLHLPWQEQRRPVDLKPLNQVVNNNDEFTNVVVESIPKTAIEGGVLPQGALKERFLHVERVCRRVALIDDQGGSLLRYALSYLQSLMVVKLDARPPPKQDEEIDPKQLNTFDILARTRYHLEKDDLEQALRYMNLLKGEPKHVAADWLKDLRLHLETVQAAEAILTYAAVRAIESM